MRTAMPGNKAFGNRIRGLREEKRKNDPSFSLRQFAEKIGISPTFLSKVETGEFDPPSADNIKKMAKLLDCDADELLALAGKVDPALLDIIRDKPKALAEFLRVASGRSEAEIKKLTEQMLKNEEVKEDLLANSHMLAKLWDRASPSVLDKHTDDSPDEPEPPWCDDDDCDYPSWQDVRMDDTDDLGYPRP